MIDPLLLFLIAVPIWIQLLLAAFVHYDANDIGMNAPKWAAIVGLIPVFGLIVYLLTRSERDYDPETDPYRDRAFEIHPSRQGEGLGPADETPAATRNEESDAESAGDRYRTDRPDSGADDRAREDGASEGAEKRDP